MKVDLQRRLAAAAAAIGGTLLIAAAAMPTPFRAARAAPPTPGPDCTVISCTTFLPLIVKNYPMPPSFEITQAIQRPGSPVLLIQNRPTYVRYTLTSTISYAGVNAYLHGLRNGTPLPGSPIAAINNPLTLKPVANRAVLDDTFNFQLPAAWLSGRVTLHAGASNGSTFNLTTGAKSIQFSTAPPLNVTIVPIRYTCSNGGGAILPDAPYDYVVNYTYRIYPVPSIGLSTHVAYDYTGPCTGGLPDPEPSRWFELLYAVTTVWQSEGQPDNYYYGLLKVYCPTSCIAGTGWIGGSKVAIGFDGLGAQHVRAGQTHAHEVGHNHGREHAPGCGADGPDPLFPYVIDGSGRIGDNAHLNYGFDIISRAIYPYTTDDIMNYCNPQWVSDYTYQALYHYAQAQHVNKLPVSQARRILLVSGWMDAAGGQAVIQPAFTLDGVAGAPTPGDYTLEILDAAGRVIAAHPLALKRAITDPARPGAGFEKTGFHLSLPHIDGIASIRLRRGAVILGALAAGPRAPAVSAGVGALRYDRRSLRISWSAVDADGDRLRYLARASVDGGATWQTLSANLSAPSIDLRAADFAGRRILLEVLASDGLNTTALRLGPFDAPGEPADTPSH